MDVVKWMDKQKITQADLGKQIGMSQQAVSWAMKHGFKAKYFHAIMRTSGGAVTAEDLLPKPKKGRKRAA